MRLTGSEIKKLEEEVIDLAADVVGFLKKKGLQLDICRGEESPSENEIRIVEAYYSPTQRLYFEAVIDLVHARPANTLGRYYQSSAHKGDCLDIQKALCGFMAEHFSAYEEQKQPITCPLEKMDK